MSILNRKKKGRRKISLRGLLVLVTLIAIGSGYLASWHRKARAKAHAVEKLQSKGADVYWNVNKVPRWLVRTFGEEYFGEVDSISHYGATDEDLTALRTFRSVTFLRLINATITDDGLEDIMHFRDLQYLDLGSPNITCKGLRRLTRFRHLTSLSLVDTNARGPGLVTLAGIDCLADIVVQDSSFDDDDLFQLHRVPQLRNILVYNSSVSGKGILALSKRLPDCNVSATTSRWLTECVYELSYFPGEGTFEWVREGNDYRGIPIE